MFNLLFALFLFGMLLTHCAKLFFKLIDSDEDPSVQEWSLLFALALGSLIALHRGAFTAYGLILD